jgi:hypothetical protein
VPLNQRWELNQSQMKFRWREQEKMMALPDLARNKPSSPVMICFPSSVFHFSFDLMLITYYICLHRFIFGLCLQVVWYKSNQEFGPLFFICSSLDPLHRVIISLQPNIFPIHSVSSFPDMILLFAWSSSVSSTVNYGRTNGTNSPLGSLGWSLFSFIHFYLHFVVFTAGNYSAL